MADPMKIRATLQGDVVEVKVLVNHPMETGQRKEPASGELIPMHFIQFITATLNGTPVLEAQWSQAISKNPFLGFRVRGARVGDKVAVSWSDNKGESNSIETTIAAG
jgi:sulfur-oxidizing protein SoxZ